MTRILATLCLFWAVSVYGQTLAVSALPPAADGATQITAVLLADPAVPIVAVEADLALPDGMTFDFNAEGQPACQFNPAVNRPQSVVNFQGSNAKVRFITLTFAADFNQPLGSDWLVRCDARIVGQLAPGAYPIRCDRAIGSGPYPGDDTVTRVKDLVTKIQERV